MKTGRKGERSVPSDAKKCLLPALGSRMCRITQLSLTDGKSYTIMATESSKLLSTNTDECFLCDTALGTDDTKLSKKQFFSWRYLQLIRKV